MFAAFLATVLFALSVVFANRTTRMLGAIRANFARVCVATVLLALCSHGFGQGLGGGGFAWFFLSGCIGFGLGDIALYQALPRIGPRLTGLLVQCLAAPFAGLAEWLWIGTRLAPQQILAGTVILAGVAVAVAPDSRAPAPRRGFGVGIACGVFAALGQGLGAVVSRKAYEVIAEGGQHVDGMTAAYQRILGGLLLGTVPMLWFWARERVQRRERRRPVSVDPTAGSRAPGRRVAFWVLLNALAGPTLGVGCYQWALATTPSGVVLPIVATLPIAVIPFAYWLEGDRPTLRSVVGGLIAVAGAVVLALLKP